MWNREILGPIDGHHAQNRSASGSVAVDDAGFYWMWAARDGLRVEAWTLDGRPKWHVDLGPDVAEYGFGTSATICGDVLIVPNDGVCLVRAASRATPRRCAWAEGSTSGATAAW